MASLDDDTRDLLRRLFAAATDLVERAHETAVEGQAADLTAGSYAACAGALRDRLKDALSIVAAAEAIARAARQADRTP